MLGGRTQRGCGGGLTEGGEPAWDEQDKGRMSRGMQGAGVGVWWGIGG